MITKTSFLAAAVIVAASLGTVQAETTHNGHSYWRGHWGNWGRHAATVGESYLLGRANLVEATGRYEYYTSQARINNEKARSMAYDNYRKGVGTYFEARAMNRKYRAAERGPRVTAEQAARYSRAAVPSRATTLELEPVFGTVHWPAVFDGPQFATDRHQVDEAFRDRDQSSRESRQVRQATTAMQTQLKSLVRDMDPSEYIAAKKFLQTLAYEARFAPKMEGLALR